MHMTQYYIKYCVKFTISRLIVNESNLYLANNSKKLRQKENS